MYVAEYFMKGQRGQWAGEGYIYSFLVTITGLVLLFLTQIDHLLTKSFHKRVAVLGSVVLVFILVNIILFIYRIKSPWYGPTFMPPGHYARGPLSQDQGNNI